MLILKQVTLVQLIINILYTSKLFLANLLQNGALNFSLNSLNLSLKIILKNG